MSAGAKSPGAKSPSGRARFFSGAPPNQSVASLPSSWPQQPAQAMPKPIPKPDQKPSSRLEDTPRSSAAASASGAAPAANAAVVGQIDRTEICKAFFNNKSKKHNVFVQWPSKDKECILHSKEWPSFDANGSPIDWSAGDLNLGRPMWVEYQGLNDQGAPKLGTQGIDQGTGLKPVRTLQRREACSTPGM